MRPNGTVNTRLTRDRNCGSSQPRVLSLSLSRVPRTVSRITGGDRYSSCKLGRECVSAIGVHLSLSLLILRDPAGVDARLVLRGGEYSQRQNGDGRPVKETLNR